MNPLGSRNVLSQPAFSDRYENTAKVVLGELLSSQLLEPEVGWGDGKVLTVDGMGVVGFAMCISPLEGVALCQSFSAAWNFW